MKRSKPKNKANKGGKTADKTSSQKLRKTYSLN